jgi:hypothetical protein
MIKLITPPAMLLTTALLCIYIAYAFLIGSIEESVPLLSGGVIAAVATYGVAMVRPWSRFLVYALTAGFFSKLGLSIYEGVQSGFYSIQVESVAPIQRSLVPAMLMAVLSLVCCAFVYRQFRPASDQAGPGTQSSTKQ